MSNYFKKFFLVIFIFISIAVFFSFTLNVFAAGNEPITGYGLKTTAETAFGGTAPFSGKTPAEIIGLVIGVGLSFIGILFFGLLLYGGFTMMIAQGNEQEVTKAKEMILAAVFGLLIVMMAYAIASFLTSSFVS